MLIKESDKLLKLEGGKQISKTPIHVKIQWKDFMDLTLIDLPGITYSQKMKGENDKKVIDIIREMIKEQVQDSKCIILLVVAADVDVGNTEAVDIA